MSGAPGLAAQELLELLGQLAREHDLALRAEAADAFEDVGQHGMAGRDRAGEAGPRPQLHVQVQRPGGDLLVELLGLGLAQAGVELP